MWPSELLLLSVHGVWARQRSSWSDGNLNSRCVLMFGQRSNRRQEEAFVLHEVETSSGVAAQRWVQSQDEEPRWSWTALEGYCADQQRVFIYSRNSRGLGWLFKHRLNPFFFPRTKAREDYTPQRLSQRWNSTWNGNRIAQHNNLPLKNKKTVTVYHHLLNLPHMSNCIKTLCSSKVSLIRSTPGLKKTKQNSKCQKVQQKNMRRLLW